MGVVTVHNYRDTLSLKGSQSDKDKGQGVCMRPRLNQVQLRSGVSSEISRLGWWGS